MKTLERPIKREDLLVLWTVRQAQDGQKKLDVVQVRGRIYYKNDPVIKKPRCLCEILIPDNVLADQMLPMTMKEIIAYAEERLAVDIADINGMNSDADSLREAMVR